MPGGQEQELEEIDKYVSDSGLSNVVEDMLTSLLSAKPEEPRKWLLKKLEADLSDESDELAESDLHKLFVATRKITSEIVPRDAIDIVISETMRILDCDIVSLFVLERKSGMLLLYASNLDTPIKVSPGQGIAGKVFNERKTVSIADCYKDRRFDKSFDRKSGYITRSLIAVPIIDYEDASVGVIQAINKLNPEAENTDPSQPAGARAVPFQRNDEKILLHLTQHVAIAMRNAEVYKEAIQASERATGLLNTIQSLSQDLGTQSLLLTITMHANKIVCAQRSTVFLVDEKHNQLWSVSTDTGQEIRIPKTAGIAGECCTEAKLINITDAYSDSRFNQAIDKKTGFRTQSILAVPMFHDTADGNGAVEVVGVIQMINKVSYDGHLEAFEEQDIEIMELFAKFVGPKLTNLAMLSKGGGGTQEGGSGEADLGLKACSSLKEAGGNSPNSKGGGMSPMGKKRASALTMDSFTENEEAEG